MKKYLVLLLLFGVHFFLLANLRFTAWPEMLSYPYLLNNGFALYGDMIHPYPPVLTGLLSHWYSWFGYSLTSLKVITWAIILINDLLIYHLLKLITNSFRYSIVGLASYVFIQPFLEGNMLWFDLAIVPLVLAGLYFGLRIFAFKDKNIKAREKHSLILAGYFFVLATLVKQTAGIFLLAYGLFILLKRGKLKDIVYISIAPLVIGAVLFFKLFASGSLGHFINWTFIYPMTKWSLFPGYVQMSLTGREWFVVVLLLIPILIGVISQKKRIQKESYVFPMVLFMFGSLIAVYPRFSFFHLQLAIALAAVFVGYLARVNTKLLLMFCGSFMLLIAFVHKPVLTSQWRVGTRFYGESDVELARMIANTVPIGDTIYFLGTHSAVYVLSERLPPKPWTDNFGWYLEIPGVQDRVVEHWDKDPPDYILWSMPQDGNWYDLGTYRPETITEWVSDNYNKERDLDQGLWLWKKI